MGLFRILFSLCLIKEIETTRLKSAFAIEGGFHLPYVSFIAPIPESVYDAILNIQYPLAMLLLLGLWMRPVCFFLLLLQGYIFFADQLNFRNHPYFFLLVLLALIFSQADQAFSFKSYTRHRFEGTSWRRALTGPTASLTLQRLIQVQVCIVYLYAAYHKLNPYYWDGHVLLAQAARDMQSIKSLMGHFLSPESLATFVESLGHAENLAWPSRISVALEIFIPLGLWNRYTRPFAIVLGLGFHTSILVFMNIKAFSWAIMGSYLLWIDFQRWGGIFAGRRTRKA